MPIQWIKNLNLASIVALHTQRLKQAMCKPFLTFHMLRDFSFAYSHPHRSNRHTHCLKQTDTERKKCFLFLLLATTPHIPRQTATIKVRQEIARSPKLQITCLSILVVFFMILHATTEISRKGHSCSTLKKGNVEKSQCCKITPMIALTQSTFNIQYTRKQNSSYLAKLVKNSIIELRQELVVPRISDTLKPLFTRCFESSGCWTSKLGFLVLRGVESAEVVSQKGEGESMLLISAVGERLTV